VEACTCLTPKCARTNPRARIAIRNTAFFIEEATTTTVGCCIKFFESGTAHSIGRCGRSESQKENQISKCQVYEGDRN
jgi:hypothetical protein